MGDMCRSSGMLSHVFDDKQLQRFGLRRFDRLTTE